MNTLQPFATVACRCYGRRFIPPHIMQIVQYSTDDVKQESYKDLLKKMYGYQDEQEWRSMFAAFAPKSRTRIVDFVKFMQSSWDLRPSSIKKWYQKKKDSIILLDQRFIPERFSILGADLCAAHFIVYRGGAVQFSGQKDWLRVENEEEYMKQLPNKYNPDYRIEGIDASGVMLLYNGLENIMKLSCLKFLNLSESPHIDDWCLDRLTGEYRYTLQHLNISGCTEVTERGVAATSRLKNLKTLNVTNLPKVKNLELVCLMLEDLNPQLEIKGVDYLNNSILEQVNKDSKSQEEQS